MDFTSIYIEIQVSRRPGGQVALTEYINAASLFEATSVTLSQCKHFNRQGFHVHWTWAGDLRRSGESAVTRRPLCIRNI